MFVTRAEKDIFMKNAVTMGTIDFLREEIEKKAVLTSREKSTFTYVDNTLTKVNEAILEKFDTKKDEDKFVQGLARRLDNDRVKVELSKFPAKEMNLPVKKYFSNFCAAYIGVRDAENYFTTNPKKIDNKLITRLKSSKTRFGKVLKRHLDDAEYGDYFEALNVQNGKYDFGVELKI